MACQQHKDIAFYYWETNYRITPFEQRYLDSLDVQKLYVRFFDVMIQNGNAVPVGTLQVQEKNIQHQIIPVVFITNETFQTLNKKEIEKLAENIRRKIALIYPTITDKEMKEIQFDCDWTVSTKHNYFYFLEKMKQRYSDGKISATIRLHQIKDKAQTGVPPINTGVLMYYATTNPLELKKRNSILDNAIAQNYIQNIDSYPLELAVALPIYSWAIVENPLGEKRLINDIRATELSDTNLYQKLEPNFYLVKQDHYIKGNYLYEDFTIKTESITTDALITAQKNISRKLKNKWKNILYFQIDSTNLTHYSVQDLKAI